MEANDPGNEFEDKHFVEPKTYIESLRERMNGPNPIDIEYLNNSRQQARQTLDFSQIEDIPDVYNRLYEDGIRKKVQK